jgi:hypothetical protein
MKEEEQSKREFLKKSAYVVPCILTLSAMPAVAGTGSGHSTQVNKSAGDGLDPQPPGNLPINDGPGSGPGLPRGKHHHQATQHPPNNSPANGGMGAATNDPIKEKRHQLRNSIRIRRGNKGDLRKNPFKTS